jgi:hypothetical protein
MLILINPTEHTPPHLLTFGQARTQFPIYSVPFRKLDDGQSPETQSFYKLIHHCQHPLGLSNYKTIEILNKKYLVS